MIFTDEWGGYSHRVGERYAGHRRIRREDRVYVQGDVHTQSIEGFFGLLKNGVRGVYHAISSTYLQNYLDKYSFRYNRRNSSTPMFWAMLDRVEKASRPRLLEARPRG